MNYMPRLDRRAFLVSSAAAGLSLGFHIPFDEEAQAQTATPEVNAWVVVKPDDTVVIRIARSEMGQGTRTGLAQLVAEELQCDWTKVTTEYPTPGQNLARNNVWKSFSTVGSRGIRESNEYVRKGGAAARMMLVQAAANAWNVPASECSAANSVITHRASGRTATYGQVAVAAAKLEAPKDADVALRNPKEWTIAGQPLKRLDTQPKTNGTHIYGLDLKLPGMVVAAIKESPVMGGKLKSFDVSKIQGRPGIERVVQVGDSAVAVVGKTFYQAKTALADLPIDWDDGPNVNVSSATIAAMLREGLDAETAFVGNKKGDAKAALASAAKKVEAVYSFPFQAHATMEPMNATALYTADRCQVWCPTQNGEAALSACAEAAGLPASQCDVIKYDLGGGFGRRGQTDYVRQAVLIAKQMPGTPVKLVWSREEDMAHDFYHPITQCKLSAGFDEHGNVTAFHMRISGQSILAGIIPAALKNGMDPWCSRASGPTARTVISAIRSPTC
jgi:isoquinoline 1-oxidoreductase subunit beta